MATSALPESPPPATGSNFPASQPGPSPSSGDDLRSKTPPALLPSPRGPLSHTSPPPREGGPKNFAGSPRARGTQQVALAAGASPRCVTRSAHRGGEARGWRAAEPRAGKGPEAGARFSAGPRSIRSAAQVSQRCARPIRAQKGGTHWLSGGNSLAQPAAPLARLTCACFTRSQTLARLPPWPATRLRMRATPSQPGAAGPTSGAIPLGREPEWPCQPPSHWLPGWRSGDDSVGKAWGWYPTSLPGMLLPGATSGC